MDDVFLLRNSACTCFGRDRELSFVFQGGGECGLYSGKSADIAHEVLARVTVPCSQATLLADLVQAGFPQEFCWATLESMRQENILISGQEEVLKDILVPPLLEAPMCEHLLVCMTGAIQSASFSPYLQALKSIFCDQLKIILTESARKLVRAKALQHLLSSEVHSGIFDDMSEVSSVPHIWLSEWASCVLVAPASAATIYRIAYGACDDLISLTVTAIPEETPVVIGPCMNSRMWQNRAVQDNVALCRRQGYWIIEPGFGVEVSKGWGKRVPQIGAFGAQPGTLVELMAQIFKRHTSRNRCS